MKKNSEDVIEVAGRNRKIMRFYCPSDMPVGERIDALSQMLTDQIGEAKIVSDQKRKEVEKLVR